MSEVSVCGQSGTLLKGQGSYDLEFSVRATEVLSKAFMYQDQRSPNSLSVLLYSIFPRYNHSHFRFLNYKIMYLINGYLTDSYSTKTPCSIPCIRHMKSFTTDVTAGSCIFA